MFLTPNQRQRRIYVEMAPRTGTNTWGSWKNITPWFLEQLDDLSQDVDDITFEGIIEQNSVSLSFNNLTGVFNPEGTGNSLWASNEYIYHSRIRYYDWTSDDEDTEYGVKPTASPLLDGLITLSPSDKLDNTTRITIVNKLDILREHYILEDFSGKIRATTSQGVYNKIIDTINNEYSALGITTNNGYLDGEFILDNITPYSQDLLKLFYTILNKGGAVGGLDEDDNLFVTTYDTNALVTKSNFEADSDAVIVYHFDDTDYASGSGTSIDDKTSSNLNAVTVNSTTDNWSSSGFFDNKVRAFYALNDSTNPEFFVRDYTIEFVLEIEKFALFKTQNDFEVVQWPTPVFAFTQQDSADLRLTENTLATDKVIHLSINAKGTLCLGTGTTSLVGSDPFDYKSYIELVQLPSEGTYAYIAITYNQDTGIYSVYLDGILRKTFNDFEGYSLLEFNGTTTLLNSIDDSQTKIYLNNKDVFYIGQQIQVGTTNKEVMLITGEGSDGGGEYVDVTRNYDGGGAYAQSSGASTVPYTFYVPKIGSRGFIYYDNQVTNPMYDTMKTYLSGFRLSDSERSSANIFTTYTKVFGQEYIIPQTSSVTLDNHTNKNLVSIDRVDRGINQVRNYVIYDNNKNNGAGQVEFWFDDSLVNSTLFMYFFIKGDTTDLSFTYSSTSDNFDKTVAYVNWVNTSDSAKYNDAKYLREELGITADISSGDGTKSKFIRISCDGSKVPYHDITIMFRHNTTVDLDFYTPSIYTFEKHFGASNNRWFLSMSPYGANNIIVSEDATSILKYGKRILPVKNYDLISNVVDIETVVNNNLTKNKDAKQRISVRTAYRYGNIKVYDRVKLSVTKENTAQIPHIFQEGGFFSSWTENGDYREKEFNVVGSRHNKDGKFTQLKLREV